MGGKFLRKASARCWRRSAREEDGEADEGGRMANMEEKDREREEEGRGRGGGGNKEDESNQHVRGKAP
eukprot:2609385-Pyramimonas_sp.AAC.1